MSIESASRGVCISEMVSAFGTRADAQPGSSSGMACAPVLPAAASPSLAEPWIDELADYLRDRRYSLAVRFVLAGRLDGTISNMVDLAGHLAQQKGAGYATRLVSAFARFGCEHCSNGTDRCMVCAGRGFDPITANSCYTCVASGLVCCDFCGGSGLAPFDVVPVSLRYPVLLRRLKIAAQRVDALSEHPMPAEHVPLVNLIWNYNKLLAVVNGAIVTARLLAEHDSRISANLPALTDACHRTARRADTALRATIGQLSGILCLLVSSQPGDSTAGGRLAGFYERLSTTDTFKGTCLHHPQLRALPVRQDTFLYS